MAVTLRVTPEQLEKVASEITHEVASIKKNLQIIDREVLGTQRYWRGDASEKHINQYNEIKPKSDEIVGKLEQAPNELLKIAGLYKESEDINSQIAMSLPDDIFM